MSTRIVQGGESLNELQQHKNKGCKSFISNPNLYRLTMDRIKLLIQKRTSLKSQITNLNNIVDKSKADNATVKLRLVRLTDLYHAFEEYNDELAVLDPEGGHHDEFVTIQDRFYALASKIEIGSNAANMSNAGGGASVEETRSESMDSIVPVKRRRIKLPEAPLPTFDGKFENWLSFRNAFQSMIGSQTDLSEIDKLHYLKSALVGEAANKIRVFAIDGVNYAKAWELLERSYEVKRILISRHLSLILNTPILDKETTSGLSKLADDTQQHIASLNALGVSVGPEMIVHILENKLPKSALERWEASLGRDEFPTLDQIYEFLYKAAVCASKRERTKLADPEKYVSGIPVKRKRDYFPNRTFVVNTSRNCIVCKVKQHPLYLCDKFKQLSVPKCIETIRNAKLCYNCLRSHRNNPCKFSSCTICQKRHNTLLHLDRQANTNKTDTSISTIAISA